MLAPSKLCTYYSGSYYLFYLVSLNSWNLNFIFNYFLLLGLGFPILHPFYTILLYKLIFSFVGLAVFIYKPIVFFTPLIFSLWVGSISIHPICLYFFLLSLFFYVFSFLEPSSIYKSFFLLKNLLLLGVFALALGGLWGLQSFTWGFIWSGDGIEWVLFLLCTLLLINLHTPLKPLNFYILVFTYLIIVLLLLLIRLNILTTRHSFIVSSSLTYWVYTLYYGLWYLANSFSVSRLINSSFLIKSFFGIYLLNQCLGNIQATFFFSYFCLFFLFLTLSYYSLRYKTVLFMAHMLIYIYMFLWLKKTQIFSGFFSYKCDYSYHYLFQKFVVSVSGQLQHLGVLFSSYLEEVFFAQNFEWVRCYSHSCFNRLSVVVVNYYYQLLICIFITMFF